MKKIAPFVDGFWVIVESLSLNYCNRDRIRCGQISSLHKTNLHLSLWLLLQAVAVWKDRLVDV